jgi:hypothetical protein
MSFLDQIGGVLQQYANGTPPGATRAQSHADYDKIAAAVPADTLASVIGPALGSLGGPQVRERIQNSAAEMSPRQRGDFMQTLLNGLQSSGVDLGGLLGQLGVNPAVAQRPQDATPGDVATVAAHAQTERPAVFNQAMEFYARHPTLVKVLGTLAMVKIAQQLSGPR